MGVQHLLTTALLLFILSMDSTTAAPADKLAPCPDSPNCVSSLAVDAEHAVAPLSFNGDPATAWDALKAVVLKQKRTRITRVEDRYLQAECRSLVFRFVDDLAFLLVPDERLIQVRSASRTGHSDFGVNRRRIERIRRDFIRLLTGQTH
ncbi:MAG: DUF1499 domain-containing protein [Gammaproteobacteria bacterium]|nr:MAG: DUF1499 domain-containing protein [Gammaproteobacteria bacterium]